MNDIGTVRPNVQSVNPGKVLPSGQAPATEPDKNGNVLPSASNSVDGVAKVSSINEVTSTEPEKKDEPAAEDLQNAVDKVNDFVQNVQRDLLFSVDEDTERTVVKVIEASSGEIIRQIPDETFMELARKMKEYGEVQLVNAKS